jgi:chromosome segregation ATPase
MALIVVSACSTGGEEYEKVKLENEELIAKARKDSLYIVSMNAEMEELYANLDSMRAQEERIRAAAAKMRSGSMTGRDGTPTIDQSFAELERLNAENQQRIADLQNKLNKAGKENSFLKRMVDELQKTVQDKEVQIQDLQVQIASLQEEVRDLQSKYVTQVEVTERTQAELTETQTELFTAFYAIGTRKDLETRGVIDAKGLFNKRRSMNSNMDNSKFTQIDFREESQIVVGKYKVKNIDLLPARLSSSYELVEEGGDVIIKIKDGRTFWKNRYLAIVVK